VVAAIAHLVNDGQGAAGRVEIDSIGGDVRQMGSDLGKCHLSFIQEGLTNALKHSQSKKVRIELVQVGEELRVVIQDWGVGFGSEQQRDEGFGLEGIRERARLLGGSSAIETAPGIGTRIA